MSAHCHHDQLTQVQRDTLAFIVCNPTPCNVVNFLARNCIGVGRRSPPHGSGPRRASKNKFVGIAAGVQGAGLTIITSISSPCAVKSTFWWTKCSDYLLLPSSISLPNPTPYQLPTPSNILNRTLYLVYCSNHTNILEAYTKFHKGPSAGYESVIRFLK